MEYKITATFSIEADTSEIALTLRLIEAAIENHSAMQTAVKFTVEEIYE